MVLPPRPAAPAVPSFASQLQLIDGAHHLAPIGITRSGHKFRASAAPYIPQDTLHTILEHEDSFGSDKDPADTMPSLPDAPQKSIAPTKRFVNATPFSSTNSGAATRPINLDETMQSAAQAPLRRLQRESKPPQRLEFA